MDYKTQFIKNLKEYRKNNNLTQDDLAEMLGYSQKNIAKWEQGFTLPSVDVMVELSKKMNISLDELLGLNKKTILEQCADYIIKTQNLDPELEVKIDNSKMTMANLMADFAYKIGFFYVNSLLDNNLLRFREYIDQQGNKDKKHAVEYLKNNGHIIEKDGQIILSKEYEIECFDLYERYLIDDIEDMEEYINSIDDQNIIDVFKVRIVEKRDEQKRFYELKEKYLLKC